MVAESGAADGGHGNKRENYNNRRPKQPCFAFRRGDCDRGSACRYSHNEADENGGFGNNNGNGKRDRSSVEGGDDQPQRRPFRVKQKKPSSMIEKKEAVEEPQVKLAKQIIARLGDFSVMGDDDDLSDNLRGLANVFVEVGDIVTFPEEISNIFIKCMTKLPVQSTVTATLLSLIYRKDTDFSALVVQKLSSSFINALKFNEIIHAKLTLRSMASLCCCNCLDLDSLVSLLNALLDFVLAEGSTSLTLEGKISLYLLSSTIPWIVSALSDNANGSEFLNKVEKFMTEFEKDYVSDFDVNGISSVFQAYAVPVDDDGNETTLEAKGALCIGRDGSACWDTLWDAVKYSLHSISGNRDGTYNIPECMLSPWTNLDDDLNDGEDKEPLKLDDDLGSLFKNVVSDAKEESTYEKSSAWLCPVFSVFDSDSSPEIANVSNLTDSFERHIIAEYCRDIFVCFEPIIEEDGTYVGTVELICTHLVAVRKMLSKEKQLSINIDCILVESIFHKLLQNPIDTLNTAYFFKSILELCKRKEFMQTLGVATHLLFQMVGEMDTIPMREFARWFSLHMANTKMVWPYWPIWVEFCKDDEEDSPQILFCKLIIDKLSRAVLPESVIEAVPEVFQSAMAGVCVPKCTASADDRFADVFHKLQTRVEMRDEPDTVLDFLENMTDIEGVEDDTWRAPLLLQVIFYITGNVPSAFISLLERYADPLRTLSASEKGEETLVKSLVESLMDEPGYLNEILDITLRRGIVTVSACAGWVSTSEEVTCLHTDIFPFKNIEVVCDRAIDIARAAVARRSMFPDDMQYDLSTDTEPLESFYTKKADDDAKESAAKDNNDDEGESNAMDDLIANDDEEMPIVSATSAVVSALKGARTAFNKIILSLIMASLEIESDSWQTSACAIMRRVLKTYADVEKSYRADDLLVVLSDRSKIQEKLDEMPDRKVSAVEKMYNRF